MKADLEGNPPSLLPVCWNVLRVALSPVWTVEEEGCLGGGRMQSWAELLDFPGCMDFLVEMERPFGQGSGPSRRPGPLGLYIPHGGRARASPQSTKSINSIYLLHKIE